MDDASSAELEKQGLPAATIRDVLQKIIVNEYKRRQAAPGLKISPRAFGTGRRVPIASGSGTESFS